ncbi:MAG: deoxyribodipyrimidine photo-lyase, partial [Fusobacteriaceae bacterium]
MIARERVRNLNEKDLSIENDYIAYWVQSSPRIEYNHTLEFAKHLCEKTGKPLFIFFVLNPNYPEAKRRSYQFLIGGVAHFSQNLKNQNLKLNVYLGDPEKIATVIAKNSVAIITDKGYLNFNRDLNKKIADVTSQSFYEIESNLIVPVEAATDHEEYGAYT